MTKGRNRPLPLLYNPRPQPLSGAAYSPKGVSQRAPHTSPMPQSGCERRYSVSGAPRTRLVIRI